MAYAVEVDDALLYRPGVHFFDSQIVWGGPYNDAAVLDRVAWSWCFAVTKLMLYNLQRLKDMGVMDDEEAA